MIKHFVKNFNQRAFLNCYCLCIARCCWYACIHLPLLHTNNGLEEFKIGLQKNNLALLEQFKVDAKDRMYQFWERNSCQLLLVRQHITFAHTNKGPKP